MSCYHGLCDQCFIHVVDLPYMCHGRLDKYAHVFCRTSKKIRSSRSFSSEGEITGMVAL